MAEILWETQNIAGKPVAVFVPSQSQFSILFLHDSDEQIPIEDAEFAAALERHHLTCFAPHGKQSLWSNRLFSAFDSERTAEQFLLVLPRVRAAVGIGMGGQAAVRLGFRYPEQFATVAAREAAFDFHELHGHGTAIDTLYERKEQARQDTALLHIVPHRVPESIQFSCSPDSIWYRGNDRLHEKLAALGIAHRFSDRDESWEWFLGEVAASLRRTERRLYG